MDGADIDRLRAHAERLGVGPTQLARRFILEGLAASQDLTEAQHLVDGADAGMQRILDIPAERWDRLPPEVAGLYMDQMDAWRKRIDRVVRAHLSSAEQRTTA